MPIRPVCTGRDRPMCTGPDLCTAGKRMSRRAVTGAPGPIEEAAVAASTTAPTTTAGRATTVGGAQAATAGTVATADRTGTRTVTDLTAVTRHRPTLGTPTS